MHTAVKFISMTSTTGRMPTMAAPTAAPTKPISEIGVERTRAPNFDDNPAVTPMMPPPSGSATSSPNAITLASVSMASCNAQFNARTLLIASVLDGVLIFMAGLLSGKFVCVDIALQFSDIRLRAAHCKFHGLVDLLGDRRVNRVELRSGGMS